MKKRPARLILRITTLIATLAFALPVKAQGLNLIRDAETEQAIRNYATPVLQAAGIAPQSVDIFIVNDKSLNAFVTVGNRMFINTGLIMKAKTPSEVIGVIAHETGHIAGGHVAFRGDSVDKAIGTSIASYLLGIGAAIATGKGEAAAVIIGAGQDFALRNFLSYTRQQEAAADQAAVKYLQATEQSPVGLRDFMSTLRGQEVLLSENQDPYLRSHPLTQERINFLDNAVSQSPYATKPDSPDAVYLHSRVRAKLIGFLENSNQVARKYPEEDTSVSARYARAISYYRSTNLEKATQELDSLLAELPEDPYFLELKGQILFEFARGHEALPYLEKAIEKAPEADPIRMLLIRVLVEENIPAEDDKALEHIEKVLLAEPNNASVWRQAAIIYGRRGDKGMTHLALAEAAFGRGNFTEAMLQSGRASELLPKGSPAWLRASDLNITADRRDKQRKKDS
ncbi:M48 family metalloprotease [Kiloniella laminariae]|uniref:M48 family metalloprotease n=1 Tax=Kiloniella laminariae TaxID=454162 RepID=A0ABT4LEA5_9PROT|nr:M48 family metalloprotease [Kiloniella laminariae]MCZ4279430.1 M48 family metalloprotease [Kiloniella laminariae]